MPFERRSKAMRRSSSESPQRERAFPIGTSTLAGAAGYGQNKRPKADDTSAEHATGRDTANMRQIEQAASGMFTQRMRSIHVGETD